MNHQDAEPEILLQCHSLMNHEITCVRNVYNSSNMALIPWHHSTVSPWRSILGYKPSRKCVIYSHHRLPACILVQWKDYFDLRRCLSTLLLIYKASDHDECKWSTNTRVIYLLEESAWMGVDILLDFKTGNGIQRTEYSLSC